MAKSCTFYEGYGKEKELFGVIGIRDGQLIVLGAAGMLIDTNGVDRPIDPSEEPQAWLDAQPAVYGNSTVMKCVPDDPAGEKLLDEAEIAQ